MKIKSISKSKIYRKKTHKHAKFLNFKKGGKQQTLVWGIQENSRVLKDKLSKRGGKEKPTGGGRKINLG